MTILFLLYIWQMPAQSDFQNSKLWRLAEKMPSIHLREASRWVHSPFVNRKEQVGKLWAYILHCLEKTSSVPDYKAAFLAVYPKERYKVSKLRLTMSDLYKTLLAFLAYKEWEGEETQQVLFQARALRHLGLGKLAQQQLRQAEEINKKGSLRNSKYFRLQYEIMAEKYVLDLRTQPANARQLQALSDTADLALLSAKLRQACLAIAHQSVYSAEYQLGFTQEALAYIEAKDLKKAPVIGLYYYCYFMLKEPENEAYFQQFKNLLFAHGSTFEEREIRDLYLMGINFCIRQVNQESEQYFLEIINLYRQGLEGGYLFENGILSRFTYYNIVAAGLRIGHYEWVENIIYQYRGKLERAYRESSFSFCLARLEYARNNYDAALPLLQKANYRDPLLYLAAKTLLLKIYYETAEYNLLEANLDAMHNYIRRKRVIGYHRTNYQNIIRYVRKLMAVNPYDKKSVETWRDQLKKEEILTERRWLLEQLK